MSGSLPAAHAREEDMVELVDLDAVLDAEALEPLSLGPGGYCSPRHGVLFYSQETMVQSALDDVASTIRQALPPRC